MTASIFPTPSTSPASAVHAGFADPPTAVTPPKSVVGPTQLATIAPGQAVMVSRCVSGDARAWRVMFDTNRPMVARFLRKLGVGEDDIEDACQEVFVQMFRYLPTFRGESLLKTWLYRLCLSEAANLRRRFRLTHALRMIMLREVAAGPAVAGHVLSDEMVCRRVAQALEALNDGERLVFVLYELEGLAGREIATIAGCPLPTVWRRLHYARRTFRAAVAATDRN